jgi:hypothetical protein
MDDAAQANRFIEIFTGYASVSSAWDDYDVFEQHQVEMEAKRGLEGPVDPADFVPRML